MELIKHKITGNTFYFIKNFLSNRSIQVRVNIPYSDTYIIHNGVPQGSVISVTVFLLAINEIITNIKQPIDVTIFLKGKNLKTSKKLLLQTLNQLDDFSNTAGFKISKNKTQAIIFSKKTKQLRIKFN